MEWEYSLIKPSALGPPALGSWALLANIFPLHSVQYRGKLVPVHVIQEVWVSRVVLHELPGRGMVSGGEGAIGREGGAEGAGEAEVAGGLRSPEEAGGPGGPG